MAHGTEHDTPDKDDIEMSKAIHKSMEDLMSKARELKLDQCNVSMTIAHGLLTLALENDHADCAMAVCADVMKRVIHEATRPGAKPSESHVLVVDGEGNITDPSDTTDKTRH